MTGGLLFSGAFFVVVIALVVKAARRRLRERKQIDEHVVASYSDVDTVVMKTRCACGRRMDKDGEGPRGDKLGVEMSCVCGRRRSLHFVVGN